MNQNFTQAKFLALLSLILIITFNTQAQSGFSQIDVNGAVNISVSLTNYQPQESINNIPLEIKENIARNFA